MNKKEFVNKWMPRVFIYQNEFFADVDVLIPEVNNKQAFLEMSRQTIANKIGEEKYDEISIEDIKVRIEDWIERLGHLEYGLNKDIYVIDEMRELLYKIK